MFFHNKNQMELELGDDPIAEAKEFCLPVGFEDCMVGVGYRCGSEPVAVLDFDKMVECLMHRDGMSTEDASEFIAYKIMNAWVGEETPFILLRSEAL